MSTNLNSFMPVLSGAITSLHALVTKDVLDQIKRNTVNHNGTLDPLNGEAEDAVTLYEIINSSDNSHVTQEEAALLLGRVCRSLETSYAEAGDVFNGDDQPFANISLVLHLHDSLADAADRIVNAVLSSYLVNVDRTRE